ncbi:DUF1799 domain-containing protein [Dyella sp.]|uniref:DUF1799 domain-containing protein n=1 Tax=Dyella sp. TaxID=1869338 RepID=UPI002848BA23|nr:DUF1799 domain-containing protein [Dyella sp.]MDR3446009.1 DUF1799 domain-containing protein [Dyella sp.]
MATLHLKVVGSLASDLLTIIGAIKYVSAKVTEALKRVAETLLPAEVFAVLSNDLMAELAGIELFNAIRAEGAAAAYDLLGPVARIDGPVGLDYGVFMQELHRNGVAGADFDDTMAALGIIEQAALEQINQG